MSGLIIYLLILYCVGGLLYAGWACELPKCPTGIPTLGDLMVSLCLLSFLQHAQEKNVHHQTRTIQLPGPPYGAGDESNITRQQEESGYK